MASGLIPLIKQAATEAVEAGNPANVTFGTVISVEPLQVRLNSSIILTTDNGVLKLGRNVTDYQVEATVQWETENDTHTHTITASEGTATAADNTHKHTITGKKTITIHNGLKVNDVVIMMRAKGGQSFVILDKVGG